MRFQIRTFPAGKLLPYLTRAFAGGIMRYLFYLCIFAGMLLLVSCSGSSSPVTPDNPSEQDTHNLAVEAALDGVEIQNTDLLSVRLGGTELLPWGLIEVILESGGTYPIEIGLENPAGEVLVSVDGAALLVDSSPVESYRGPVAGNIAVTDLEERIVLHIKVPGENPQVRDITIRTAPNDAWPTIANLGVENFIEPETGISFDIAVREVCVGVTPGTDIKVVEALVGSLGCEILRALPNIDVYRVRIPDGSSYEHYFRLYESSGIVLFAEPNAIHYPDIVPNDTYEEYEYGNGLMQLYEAWDIDQGSSDTIVAIVDSGIMRDHPDLYENVIDGEDFIDPPGDGLGGETPGNGVDENNDGYADGNVGHGTHCAGIAGAVGNNSEGVSGHTWNTHLLPCRVFPVDGDSGANDTDVADAIMWASDQGAIAISLSLGSPYGSGTEQAAINYAWGNGSVIVAAAGNSNSTGSHYPSMFPNVISVASTTANDTKSSFSNYSTTVDCSAPGSNITSTYFYEHGGDPWSVSESNRYASMSGTSMACPQVSGLIGLVASYYPTYTNSEVADQVVFTADNIDAQNPSYVGMLGTGRINAYNALTMPLAPDFEILKLWTDDDNPLYSQGNRDGFLNPGEIIEFKPTIRNTGTKAAPDCMLSLEGAGTNFQTLNAAIDLGFFDRGDTITPDVPLIFRVDPNITDDTVVDLTLHFEFLNGDPIDVLYPVTVRTDKGVVDTIGFYGEGLLEDEIRKGVTGVAALSFTIEGDLNYGTLDELIVHQTGSAAPSSFTDVQLWLDSDGDGVFIPQYDTRIAYQSYDHEGYRGTFDDLNDPSAGFNTGIDYEPFPDVLFDDAGLAHFYEIVLPTAPGVPRTVYVVIGILPAAVTGETVQIGILTADDVTVRVPDQVNPLDFPIQSDEVPIVGTWLDPVQLTISGPSTEPAYSWRAETDICPVTNNVYVVFDSNRLGDFDVFIRRSTDQAENFDPALLLDDDGGREFYPDVAVDSAGVVHVVYYSTKIANDNREIYYARSTDNGATFEDPVRLTDATRDSRIPKIAVGPDDSLNIAWHDNRTGSSDYNIYFKRSDDGGDTWTDDLMVADTSDESEEAAIAVGGDGVIHITWEEFSGWYAGNTFYARSIDDGLNFSSPVQLSSGTYDGRGYHSDVVADDLGHVYVVFHYVPWGEDAEITSVISDNSGESWNTPLAITDNDVPDSRPAIHVMPDGSWIDIVYRIREAGTWNIRHVQSDDGLATWSEPFQISISDGGDAREPVVARAANFNIYAFWEDIVNANGDYEVFYNRFLF